MANNSAGRLTVLNDEAKVAVITGAAIADRRPEPARSGHKRESNPLDNACARVLHWLDPEQIAQMRAVATLERVRAHAVIDPDDESLWYLATGAVRVSYIDQGCKRRVSNFLGPGDALGNPFFCSPGTVRVFETITESSILKIPAETFAQVVVGVPWKTFKQCVTATLGTAFSLLALNTRLRGVRAI